MVCITPFIFFNVERRDVEGKLRCVAVVTVVAVLVVVVVVMDWSMTRVGSLMEGRGV
jgi:heme/copper-type cytochrome/quinol oxidase subunit 4